MSSILRALGDSNFRKFLLSKIDIKEYKKLYFELILEVEKKVQGESRHETAKRFIREHQTSANRTAQELRK